jgi:type IV secretory pathway VirB2 component (pilin)
MNKQKMLCLLNVLVAIVSTIAIPAFAQGLDKANESVDMVINILNGVSIGVATIAFMWIGFKYLFSTIDKTEIGRIVVGALVIGGAAQLASFFIS